MNDITRERRLADTALDHLEAQMDEFTELERRRLEAEADDSDCNDFRGGR